MVGLASRRKPGSLFVLLQGLMQRLLTRFYLETDCWCQSQEIGLRDCEEVPEAGHWGRRDVGKMCGTPQLRLLCLSITFVKEGSRFFRLVEQGARHWQSSG